MPRYYFNVYDGFDSPDQEGTELRDLAMARREAIRLAGAIIDNDADRIKVGEDWRLEVTDESGLLLFRIDFSIVESPAVAHIVSEKPEAIA